MKLSPATYIHTPQALHTLVAALANEPLLALDTESNSLHAYRERVCLIQLSTRTADYILDPLALSDLTPLAPLLADPCIEKVFHAAEYDIMCLKRDFGFTFTNLFDTMLAARICGHKAIGLGDLLKRYVGVQVDKRHQRDDWGRRPLSRASLRYAQIDTHYLPTIRDHLRAELARAGRLAEAQEVFDELCHVQPPDNTFDPDGFWRIGRPARLSRRQMAVLRELYLLREELARQRDCPPFKILDDSALITLARHTPQRHSDLKALKGISTRQISRYGGRILDAIQRGQQAELPAPPPKPQPTDPQVLARYTALRNWRKRRARQRGVESDIIVSKSVLWHLAQTAPTTLDQMRGIHGLGPWRLATYGPELLAVLRQHPNGTGE